MLRQNSYPGGKSNRQCSRTAIEHQCHREPRSVRALRSFTDLVDLAMPYQEPGSKISVSFRRDNSSQQPTEAQLTLVEVKAYTPTQ